MLNCIELLTALVMASSIADLDATIEALARSADGRVGAAVLLVESESRAGVHETERFPMQSVYKVPIAMAVLRGVDEGRLGLEQTVSIDSADIAIEPVHSPIRELHPRGGIRLSIRDLLRAAVLESDGTASDKLLQFVNPDEVTAYVRSIGVDSMVIATTETALAQDEFAQYRNWTTPEAAASLLHQLRFGEALSASSRDLMLRWMTETPTGPRRIKAGVPSATAVAHKTGTDRTVDGLTRTTNDIGIVTLPDGRHLIIAVFVRDSRANAAAREGVIAALARAAWDCFVHDKTAQTRRP